MIIRILMLLASEVALSQGYTGNSVMIKTPDGTIIDHKGTSLKTAICGQDDSHCADVNLDAGIRRLQTSSIVTVQSTFGLDPQGTSFFFFGATLADANGIGAAGDTVRVQIPAAVTPLGTLYPAVDATYTILAADTSDPNPERAVAKKVCTMLNADSNFIASQWKCDVSKDFAYVHIGSRLFNEFGERASWTVTCSGTTVCNLAFSDIKRRAKAAELSRSPNDPGRLGIFAITGTVLSIPGGIGKRYFEIFTNGNGSSDMRKACSTGGLPTADCDFFVPVAAADDVFVNQLRCYGGCAGIKYDQFLCKNVTLTNGIQITIRSDNQTTTLPLIKRTEDWKNKFSFNDPGSAFRIDIQAAADQFVAVFRSTVPFVVRKSGTFGAGNDDFVRIRIQDDFTGATGGNLKELECLAEGFKQEL